MVADMEEVGGRHDEPEIYDGEPGDPGLAGGPGSMSWEINGDIGVIGVAGSAAIVMEVLHPSVMAGVFTQSSYRTQPLQRARNTLGYVLRTTYGSTPGATSVIERVKRIHSRVGGVRPDGREYQALDPELIAWVHTCIPWAIMTAFDRYRRPLTIAEKDRYLAEQAVIGRMGGAESVPASVAELDDFVESMRPELAVNEQTRSFIRFLAEGHDRRRGGGATGAGRPLVGPAGLDDADAGLGTRADRARARQRRGTGWPRSGYEQLKADLGRWAAPVLPCEEMARRRAGVGDPGAAEAPDRAAAPLSA